MMKMMVVVVMMKMVMMIGKMRGPFKVLVSVCLDVQLSETKLREEPVTYIRNHLVPAAHFL